MSMSMLARDSLGRLRRLAKFFNTGLLGAIITTIVASIAWQLFGLPIAFLSTVHLHLPPHLSFLGYWYLLWAWVLAWINKTVAGYQRDEVYIGTAEERAAKNHADDDEQLHMGPGHLVNSQFYENVPPALQNMKSDASGVPLFYGQWRKVK
jgi:hypothetical protein